MSFRGAATVLCSLALLCGVPGCGGSSNGRVEIHGTVKLDGKPVENGAIAFIPGEGVNGPSAGSVIQAGKYQVPALQGPAVGKHRVEITATRTAGTATVKGVGASTGGPSAGGSVSTIEIVYSGTIQQEVVAGIRREGRDERAEF